MKLFWKILKWMLLVGVVIFVLFIVLCLSLINRRLNHPSCDSAEDVVESMEVYVDYDFDSEDYEVVDWWCSTFPDVQKGVTLVVNDEKAWRDIVKYFKAQEDNNSSTADKERYCKYSTYDEYGAEEGFILNYKTRKIEYSFNDW